LPPPLTFAAKRQNPVSEPTDGDLTGEIARNPFGIDRIRIFENLGRKMPFLFFWMTR
jgi:hypothetical protein